MKIFSICFFICLLLTSGIATAQDKKVFDNVGVYFGPHIPVSSLFDNEGKAKYGGYTIEIGSKANIIEKKMYVFLGAGYGTLNYDYYLEDMIFGIDRPFNNLTAKRFDLSINGRYNVLKNDGRNLLLFHIGLNAIFHFYEKIYDTETLILRLDNFRFVNLNLPVGFSYERLVSENISISVGVESFLWINLYTPYKDYIGVINSDYLYGSSYPDFGFKLGLIYNFKNN